MPERIATPWLWGRVLILELRLWLSEDSILRSCQEAGGTQGIEPAGDCPLSWVQNVLFSGEKSAGAHE